MGQLYSKQETTYKVLAGDVIVLTLLISSMSYSAEPHRQSAFDMMRNYILNLILMFTKLEMPRVKILNQFLITLMVMCQTLIYVFCFNDMKRQIKL